VSSTYAKPHLARLRIVAWSLRLALLHGGDGGLVLGPPPLALGLARTRRVRLLRIVRRHGGRAGNLLGATWRVLVVLGWRAQVHLWKIWIGRLPLANLLLLGDIIPAPKMIIHVVCPLRLGLLRRLRRHIVGALAETAPELAVAVALHPTLFTLLLQLVLVFDMMLLVKVLLERLAPVALLDALLSGSVDLLHVASPHLELVVLRVLVPLPVALAPEPLGAGWERAAVWLLMALSMLPMYLMLEDGM